MIADLPNTLANGLICYLWLGRSVYHRFIQLFRLARQTRKQVRFVFFCFSVLTKSNQKTRFVFPSSVSKETRTTYLWFDFLHLCPDTSPPSHIIVCNVLLNQTTKDIFWNCSPPPCPLFWASLLSALKSTYDAFRSCCQVTHCPARWQRDTWWYVWYLICG